ncbi:PAS domain-containing protein [Tabrizicola sp. BL-A-41-H6]|uniref:PAS domain-containing protein n=1 Tax=Tabrizicola sp. BL-A-41-H6 TaxID=3421107 RepID=UPI003D670018
MDAGIFGTPRPPMPQLAGGPAALVRGYWEALRTDGGIPLRAAIDPRGLSGALDRVFLAERIGAGLAQVRLSGTRVNELSGMDVRGLPLSCLFHPDARGELSRVVEGVFKGPRGAELHLTARKELGRPLLAARLLLLPLLDRAGDCTLLLGCIDIGGEIGRAPRRFDILRSVEERLLCAADPAPEPAAQSAKAAQSYLRLVYSAD